MENVFKKLGFNPNSPALRWIAIISLVLLLVIALNLSVEDYATTREGYKLGASRKVFDWTADLIAALPQVLQIVIAALSILGLLKSRWRGPALLALLVIDNYYDITFRASGIVWTGDVWADGPNAVQVILECLFIFTFGSEFLLIFTIEHLTRLLRTDWPKLRDELMRLAEEGNSISAARQEARTASPRPATSKKVTSG